MCQINTVSNKLNKANASLNVYACLYINAYICALSSDWICACVKLKLPGINLTELTQYLTCMPVYRCSYIDLYRLSSLVMCVFAFAYNVFARANVNLWTYTHENTCLNAY